MNNLNLKNISGNIGCAPGINKNSTEINTCFN